MCVLTSMLCWSLAACQGDSDIQISNDGLVIPVPEAIRQVASLNSQQLSLEVSVNGNTVREQSVSQTTDDITVRVNVPAEQSNEINISWFAIVESRNILLADFSDNVPAGESELRVVSYNSTGIRFDEDGDTRSNLSEAREGRNLLSPIDANVPFGTTFGSGNFGTILNDGIDNFTSGNPVDPQPIDTTFSLRHDNTNLIVYVCGQDASLWEDSGIQFWEDDTVYIYLDGEDNNSTSYDADDFQLAFVRSAIEENARLEIPRGSPDPISCLDGSCIDFTFFNFNQSCTYELSASIPLAEFNITVGENAGFDLEFTDDDDGGQRDGSSAWIGFDDRSDLDPSTFGTIFLAPQQ